MPSVSKTFHQVYQEPSTWYIINCGDVSSYRIREILVSEDRFRKPQNMYIFQISQLHPVLFIPESFRKKFSSAQFVFL